MAHCHGRVTWPDHDDCKRNQITAVLARLDAPGACTEVDELGCRRVVTDEIIKKKGDSVSSRRKSNPPRWAEAIKSRFGDTAVAVIEGRLYVDTTFDTNQEAATA